MSSALDVEAIAKTLNSATSFTAVFGTLPIGDHKVQRSAVRKQFAYLAQMVHPDHVHAAPHVAEKAFDHLRALYDAAEDAILAGTYAKPFTAGLKPGAKAIEDFFELTSKAGIYRCNNTPYKVGDFSVLYRAQISGNEVLVKIAKEPTANALMETEAGRLKKFRATEAMKGIHRFLPEILDTFMIPGPDRRQFRANVTNVMPGVVSLTDIKAAFPGGLVPQHAAWIVRRVMAQACAANMTGLIHAAITPDHVLVDPIKHEPCHIGWLHATEKTRLTMIVERWKDWYPPEIFDKKPPTHQTDIYMAGMTCLWLFSGNTSTKSIPSSIPKPISDIILSCVNADPKKRPPDGLKVLNDITTAIRTAWGRSYQPLMMPL